VGEGKEKEELWTVSRWVCQDLAKTKRKTEAQRRDSRAVQDESELEPKCPGTQGANATQQAVLHRLPRIMVLGA
jgi:hypothetical protein